MTERQERDESDEYFLYKENRGALMNDQSEGRKNKEIQGSKPSFRERVQFLRRNREMGRQFETELSIKMSNMKVRPPSRNSREKFAQPRNQILTIKSLKSLNTTDSNNKRESGESADSEAYASFYQMNEIL